MPCPPWPRLLAHRAAEDPALGRHLAQCAACRARLEGASADDAALRDSLLCPSPERLALVLDGEPPDPALRAHLALCEACAMLVGLPAAERPVSPARARRVAARVLPRKRRRRYRPRPRRPAWGLWAAAAAVLLALGLFAALPRPGDERRAEGGRTEPEAPERPEDPAPEAPAPEDPAPEVPALEDPAPEVPTPEVPPTLEDSTPEAPPPPDEPPPPRPEPAPEDPPPATIDDGWLLAAGTLLDDQEQPRSRGRLTAAAGVSPVLERGGARCVLAPGTTVELGEELHLEQGALAVASLDAPRPIGTPWGEVGGAFDGGLAVTHGGLLLSVVEGVAQLPEARVEAGERALYDGRGLTPLGAAEAPGFALDAARVEALARAQGRALRFLENTAREDGTWGGTYGALFPAGLNALVLRALCAAHPAPKESPGFVRSLRAVRKQTPRRVVEAALLLELYAALPRSAGSSSDRDRARECVELLVASALGDGWSYPGRGVSDAHNHSAALFGLEAAAELGLDVPAELLARGLAAQAASQRADGSWSYLRGERARGSATAAALVTLARHGETDGLDAGRSWLLRNAGAAAHPGQGDAWQYTWWLRLRQASRELFAFDPWGAPLLDALLAAQLPDGRFEPALNASGFEREDAFVATAYALLILASYGIPPRDLDDDPPAGPRQDGSRITLRYAPPEGARVVAVAGSFNGWVPAPIEDADGDGIFTVSLDLPRGTHSYKLVVDGCWSLDPWNPRQADDGEGNLNSLLEVR